MSFKPAISEDVISNEALALLPADPVPTLNEPSIEARECRRAYKPVVASLLEKHHWNLATKRAALAPLDNDRAGEWGLAYAKPDDMAYPVALFPASGSGWGAWFRQGQHYMLPGGYRVMMQVGKTIYSQIGAAMLEYTSFGITEADFTTQFKDLVVLELAARIAVPITKDYARARELKGQAEFERQRAIAADLNRNAQRYGDNPTESELVRGVGIGGYGGGWPMDPVANPIYQVAPLIVPANTGE